MFLARCLLIAALVAVGLVASPVLAANPSGSETPIIDTHVPEPNEPVQYELSLAPGVPTAGSITAMDRYEWYCFKVNNGVAVAITVATTSGGLQPNCGLLQGVVNDGVQVTNLGQILAATNSLSTTSVTLNYTPNFTGPVTLWVAGALSSTGNYNVTMTGGEQRSGCSPCPTCVATAPPAPPDDEAQFKVGPPTFAAPDFIDVPLLVDTHEGVTFTQMRIEYHSSCLTYVSTVVGPDVGSPGSILDDDAPGAVDPGSNRHVQLNVSGTYNGCSRRVFIVRFQFTPGHVLPCSIVWDPTLSGPNSNNHLNYTPGGDGKILPDDITFCDGEITCDPNVEIDGTVEYYSNGTPIIATRPDAMSPPVTVEDCTDQMPTTTATSPLAEYLLAFGTGPVSVDLCAKRPRVVCGTNEDGVISGDDVIDLQNDISPPPSTTNPKLIIAGDVNRDGNLDATDVVGIKRWIGRKVCDGTDVCGGAFNNCSGTWRFIFFTDPNAPTVFQTDHGNLTAVCNDATVPIEGILVGDFDGSWPLIFTPKPASQVDLALGVKGWEGDEVLLALRANLDAGESLRHVIYSLDYDATAFEYLGMQVGSKASTWGWFDNPDNAGVAHGIAHIPPRAEELAESGEVIVFRLRARSANASSAISFSRLKANDLDVVAPEIQVGRGNAVDAVPMPSTYSLTAKPNPFNPSTRVTFTIPAGGGSVPVVLRIFDVSGHAVRTLVEGARGPGFHHVVWDGDDAMGNASSAGVYFLRIEAGTWSSVEKLTLVK